MRYKYGYIHSDKDNLSNVQGSYLTVFFDLLSVAIKLVEIDTVTQPAFTRVWSTLTYGSDQVF